MSSSRFTTGQWPSIRKPRVEGKPSMLPKPRRAGSTDRTSVEARRPSASYRSSSAEPARVTLAGSRPSREASAQKLPLNRRSRSQQNDIRYGQSSMTPLRSSVYSRTTGTPQRTPSEDRMNRSWQASVERALAFLTIKDQRTLTNMSWQRGTVARVSEALSARGAGAPLVRPLSIARFVDVSASLLAALTNQDIKLNNDNYVTKLPNLAKKFLYPGVMSKSWLKTVNTLHAFPHALAFIAYFIDLLNHSELPVSDEWLYVAKDDLTCLRRDYLSKCWIRFQELDTQFDDLNQEYLQQLKELLGDDEQKIKQLNEVIEECQAILEDKAEECARAEYARVEARRSSLLAAVRGARGGRLGARGRGDEARARGGEQQGALKTLDEHINAITGEIQQLKKELEVQTMSVEERSKLLDEVEYATRVIDSKRTLVEQVTKMLLSKETELAHWQKRTLDSCVQYKQGLIHLSAQFPEVATLAVDEKELMEEECLSWVCRAVESLKALATRLGDTKMKHQRSLSARTRQRDQLIEENKIKLAEIKANIDREQQALEAEMSRESSEAASWTTHRQELTARLDALKGHHDHYTKVQNELEFCERQDKAWQAKLIEMQEYIENLKEEAKRSLDVEKRRRANAIMDLVKTWNERLDRVERQEREIEDRDRLRREKEKTDVLANVRES